MSERPRTERLRVADALLAARESLARAEQLQAQEPTPVHQEAVARAKRELEALERRTLQVND